MEEKIQNTIRQLRSLHQYKDLSDKEIYEIAKKQVELKQKVKDLNLDELFFDSKEKKKAKELAKKYLQEFVIENISDKNILKSLIYLEILNFRLQERTNDLYKKNSAVPLKIVETIHRNLEKINELKEKLGLTNKQESDAFKYIQLLKKKFKIWLQNNPDRYSKCPYCNKVYLLKLKTEYYTPEKFSFLYNNRPYNKKLFENYNKTVTIDKKFLAEVLEVSEYYIDWILKKMGKK